MFSDVKIMSPQGKVKKVVSGQELSKRHWDMFYFTEANKTLNSNGKKQVPGWVKKRLDREYNHIRESSN